MNKILKEVIRSLKPIQAVLKELIDIFDAKHVGGILFRILVNRFVYVLQKYITRLSWGTQNTFVIYFVI